MTDNLDESTSASSDDETPSDARETHLHLAFKVGAWLFTNDKPKMHWITPEQIAPYYSKDGQYPESILKRLSQKDLDTANRMGKIEASKELRGEDVSQ
jgi:hypothetical protein